jgi:hypothetical protein
MNPRRKAEKTVHMPYFMSIVPGFPDDLQAVVVCTIWWKKAVDLRIQVNNI